MKLKRLIICTVVLLGINVTSHACFSGGDSPRNYNIYRVYDKPVKATGNFFYAPDYKARNLKAWADETYFKGDLYEVEKVVYRYSLDELLDLYEYGTLPNWDKDNAWADWNKGSYYAEYLVVAKQCEEARATRNDPWFYPASKRHGFTTLEGLLKRIDEIEKEVRANSWDGSFPDEDRYNLQRTRIYFSLGRYKDCVNLWHKFAKKLPDNNVMKAMIKDYVAGAYCRLGDTETAKRMFLELGNYSELAQLSHAEDGCWAYAVKAIYDIEPDCNNIVAYNMQAELEHYISWIELDPKKLKKYYDVMCYITRTHRSKDMAIWYYTKAYLEDQLGYPNTAAVTIAEAERCKTSAYMHNSIRLFRMYIDAKTLPANQAYEKKLYSDMCWLDTLIVNNITPEIRDFLLEEQSDRYQWHVMWGGLSFYYYNDIMRKIIIAEAAPKFMEAGNKTLAVQLYNYADNVLFKQVVPEASHCFLNYFFSSMYHDCTGAEIEAYITRALHPVSKFDHLLNKGSYIETDYLYDIAGTVYLREQKYQKAMECLSKVSNTYQTRLHTAEYMNADPFCADMYAGYMWGQYPFTDYKYNFAREMCSLEQVMNNPNVDVNRRASAQLRYAIGMRNSYFRAWPLTQYSVGRPTFVDSYDEWMNSEREDKVLARYKALRTAAFRMFTDDEAAAEAHYVLKNTYTIVTQYPNTRTASYVRGHCDTYFDYHLDKAKKFYGEPYYCYLTWRGRSVY